MTLIFTFGILPPITSFKVSSTCRKILTQDSAILLRNSLDFPSIYFTVNDTIHIEDNYSLKVDKV